MLLSVVIVNIMTIYIGLIILFCMNRALKIGIVVGCSTIVGLISWALYRIKRKKRSKAKVALLGDVGGTNIRLKLVVINEGPIELLKQNNLMVEDYDSLQGALEQFLRGVPLRPDVAVIAIAGPTVQNTVALSNVPKWGTMLGDQLGARLSIPDFSFINDFEAVSYGLLLVPDDKFESLNGLQVCPTKTRGVIGPGTGLGTSIIYPYNKKQIVLPCEGGHIDPPLFDPQFTDFVAYLSQNSSRSQPCLERTFCGPTIPLMRKFFQERDALQNAQGIGTGMLSSEQIISNCISEEQEPLNLKTFELFLKIYIATIGNFLVSHMCTGGLYLAGSLTNSILPLIRGRDILSQWRQRHPQMNHISTTTPLLVCKEIDLGLLGAEYVARNIIADYHSL